MAIKLYSNGTESTIETKEEHSYRIDDKFAQVAHYDSEELQSLVKHALERVEIARGLMGTADHQRERLQEIYEILRQQAYNDNNLHRGSRYVEDEDFQP
ncbi:hypothetical protein OH710_05520 [Pseudomonas capsici]|uniref:hypothetical protein n=1 Tax=Pseudomonas capsici TaxID=2810614 RepID=UPI000EFFEFCA|nr:MULTISPECIES: hypothetical protein [Pseudomonas]MCV4272095.1 hypothetical protein [Pseudomonas capsici]GFM55224.1 hypothetical protein PSCICF_14020 [Pseudomonas cichorii]